MESSAHKATYSASLENGRSHAYIRSNSEMRFRKVKGMLQKQHPMPSEYELQAHLSYESGQIS